MGIKIEFVQPQQVEDLIAVLEKEFKDLLVVERPDYTKPVGVEGNWHTTTLSLSSIQGRNVTISNLFQNDCRAAIYRTVGGKAQRYYQDEKLMLVKENLCENLGYRPDHAFAEDLENFLKYGTIPA